MASKIQSMLNNIEKHGYEMTVMFKIEILFIQILKLFQFCEIYL